MDKGKEFLKELGELTKKYKLYIGGCGCCSSPFIDDENSKFVFLDLEWDNENQRYKADKERQGW